MNCKSLANTGKSPKARVTDSLPPTKYSFRENVAHKYLLFTSSRNAFVTHPTSLDATKYGWSKDEDSGCLTSKFTPIQFIPSSRWNAEAHQELLRTAMSSYVHHIGLAVKNDSLTCTMFGSCQGGNTCHNDHTLQIQQWDGKDGKRHSIVQQKWFSSYES